MEGNLLYYKSIDLDVYIILLCFLGPHLRHMEVPRLGVELELQLLAYTTATATQDLSHICDLHYSSPLSKARDPTCTLVVTSWRHFH